MPVVFTLISIVSSSAQTMNDHQILETLNQMSSAISAENYKSASSMLIPVLTHLMAKNKGKPLPSSIDGIELKKGDAALTQALQQLRGHFLQNDSAAALKSAYVLGISLNQRASLPSTKKK